MEGMRIEVIRIHHFSVSI